MLFFVIEANIQPCAQNFPFLPHTLFVNLLPFYLSIGIYSALYASQANLVNLQQVTLPYSTVWYCKLSKISVVILDGTSEIS